MAERVDETSNFSQREEVIQVNGTNDMICAPCFSRGEETGADGICKVCKYYLCSDCVHAHRKDTRSCRHEIAFFYCARKMSVNKLVRANSFCLDCGQYLCKKCRLDHSGFWMYRHHTLIGGKNVPDDMFDHIYEKPCRGKQGPGRSSRAVSRQSRRTVSSTSRNSPTVNRREREKTKIRDQSRNTSSGERNRKSSVAERKVKSPESVRISSRQRTPKFSCAGNRKTTKKINVNVGGNGDKKGNRTLIHSSTGIDETVPKKIDRPKTVRFEDQPVEEAVLVADFTLASPDEKPSHIICCVLLQNNKFVVADKANENIKLYDDQFQFSGSISLSPFPVALCESRTNDSELFASSMNFLYRIGTETAFVTDKEIPTDVPKIEGLASCEAGIAVIFTSIDSPKDKTGQWEIHLLDHQGVVKFHITIRSPLVVKLVTPLWHVTTNKEGTLLLVSDTYNNRIVGVDMIKWCVVYVLKGQEKGTGPTSLCMGTDDNILAVWYNEIHEISTFGRDFGTIVPQIDKTALTACERKNKHLVVCSGSKSYTTGIQVYKL